MAAALLAGTLAAWVTAPDDPDPVAALATSAATPQDPTPTAAPADSTPPGAAGPAPIPTRAADPASAGAVDTPGAVPARLSIPPIDASLPISAVGVASSGAMSIPKDPRRAGWYRYSAGAGADEGATVLAAHVDSRRYGAGPLAKLRSLKKGDPIRLTSKAGTEVFVVKDVLVLDKDGLDLDALFDRAGPHRLHVVTCGGSFDTRTGHYEDNVVVTAYPKGSP